MTPTRLRAARALSLSFAILTSGLFAAPAHAEPVPLRSEIGPSAVGTWKSQDGDEITVESCGSDRCGILCFFIIP